MTQTTQPTAEEISRVMKHLSSLGAAKGGRARAAALSKTRRQEIAKKAAATRWAKKKPSH